MLAAELAFALGGAARLSASELAEPLRRGGLNNQHSGPSQLAAHHPLHTALVSLDIS